MADCAVDTEYPEALQKGISAAGGLLQDAKSQKSVVPAPIHDHQEEALFLWTKRSQDLPWKGRTAILSYGVDVLDTSDLQLLSGTGESSAEEPTMRYSKPLSSLYSVSHRVPLSLKYVQGRPRTADLAKLLTRV
eukprot:CAMPEP_0170619406 /NCGR_PEP_ID=MMETSP0224-20130122/27498_1 /TAXON_ID=285029 /ORGANISM="Togula jolla, Strain CCCM 725" /LENGTH=133 /DNA_ID=CAMNT_0010945491 /DNA_START=188 /DNA_END=589 /DNA_ORIENTATION=-